MTYQSPMSPHRDASFVLKIAFRGAWSEIDLPMSTPFILGIPVGGDIAEVVFAPLLDVSLGGHIVPHGTML